MSTNTEKAAVETTSEQDAPGTELAIQGEHGRPQDSTTMQRLFIEGIAVAVALLATVVIYVFFLVHPFEPTPRNLFLIFERGNAGDLADAVRLLRQRSSHGRTRTEARAASEPAHLHARSSGLHMGRDRLLRSDR